MPHATNRGCRLFWERAGREDAPALLLIRGLGRSGRYWGALRDLLGRSFHLVVTDNRGVGRSDAPRPPYATWRMADDHAAILDAAGVARAHVFGMSLGGMIAQELALRHPSRVDRLVLGCTTPGGARAVRYPARGLAALLRASVGPVDRAMRSMAPHLLSAETLRARPEIVEQWIAIAEDEPKHRLGLFGQLFAASQHDTWDDLPRIAAPTLVVTGDLDTLIHPDNSRLLEGRIPGARLRTIAGAAHDFPADRPDESAALLEEFLLDRGEHVGPMRAAIAEAERARGGTGDNPWVGSVIVVDGAIVARGHTQGPGEDHAEIGALRDARARGIALSRATLYSTLEPCSFHGRTPACAKVIAESGVRRLVTGIRDPNPRVDGAGAAIVRAAGIEVVEGICADEIRRQLGAWIAAYHPHEPIARARGMRSEDEAHLARALAELYALDAKAAGDLARRALLRASDGG